jgi:hypothetical protein
MDSAKAGGKAEMAAAAAMLLAKVASKGAKKPSDDDASAAGAAAALEEGKRPTTPRAAKKPSEEGKKPTTPRADGGGGTTPRASGSTTPKSGKGVAQQAQGLSGAEKQKLEEAAADHIDLIESLNRKVDKQLTIIEDNKALIIDKLAVFQAGVINELKEATSHFSFKAYEESFRKIEMDMDTFYKELLRVREEGDTRSKEMSDWKQRLGQDLLNFYKKYDSQSADLQNMTTAEKDTLNGLVMEMSENISKSK